MLNSLNILGYHPSGVFRSKRAAREQELKKLELQAKTTGSGEESKEAESKSDRPAGVQGLLHDTIQYLTKAYDAAGHIGQSMESLVALAAESLNPEFSDEDRKPINKKFIAVRQELDKQAKQTAIEGDPLFSGKFDKKPKILKIGEGDGEQITVSVEPFTLEALGLTGSRVESLASAKKAAIDLEKVRGRIKGVKDNLNAKINSVTTKLNTLKAADDFEKQVTESSDKDLGEDPLNNPVSGFHYQLRELQQRAARAKGRSQALLVNLRI